MKNQKLPAKQSSKNKNPNFDKNLQDDWIPDLTRSPDSTSKELPEYGGDLKDKEGIESQKRS